jgi:hypothetical protein
MDCEPGLADSPRAAQGQSAGGARDPANLAYFAFAADKGIKLLAGISVNTQFHVVTRLVVEGNSRTLLSGTVAKVTCMSDKGNHQTESTTHVRH